MYITLGSADEGRMGSRGVVLLAILFALTGCVAARHELVRHELARLVEDLSDPPNSVQISRAEKATSGADPRCDGYLISRLYGTNEPMDRIIEFVEDDILVLDGWVAQPGLLDETTIGLRHEAGYRLAIADKQPSPELLTSPFFYHKEVELDQPYATILELTLVHSDPRYLERCFGGRP